MPCELLEVAASAIVLGLGALGTKLTLLDLFGALGEMNLDLKEASCCSRRANTPYSSTVLGHVSRLFTSKSSEAPKVSPTAPAMPTAWLFVHSCSAGADTYIYIIYIQG